MLRIFDLFGKSTALKAVDKALREAGVHPALVPEAVKLTLLRLARSPDGSDSDDDARLLAYCMLGHQGFAEANDPEAAAEASARLEDAMEAGDSRDARVIMLAQHAGLIAPEIAAQIDIDET